MDAFPHNPSPVQLLPFHRVDACSEAKRAKAVSTQQVMLRGEAEWEKIEFTNQFILI